MENLSKYPLYLTWSNPLVKSPRSVRHYRGLSRFRRSNKQDDFLPIHHRKVRSFFCHKRLRGKGEGQIGREKRPVPNSKTLIPISIIIPRRYGSDLEQGRVVLVQQKGQQRDQLRWRWLQRMFSSPSLQFYFSPIRVSIFVLLKPQIFFF